MRFQQPGQTERAFDVHADTGIVHLDPRWHQAFFLFARDGFFHILDGTDHLLFLLVPGDSVPQAPAAGDRRSRRSPSRIR